MLRKGLWYFVVICVAVAVWNTMPHEPAAFMADLRAKSDQLKEFAEKIGGNAEEAVKSGSLGTGTAGGASGGTGSAGGGPSGTGSAAAGAAGAALASLAVSEQALSGYDRDEWRHWDNLTSCWTVREEALFRDAVPGSVSLRDRDGRATADKKNACEIGGGKWIDPYTGQTFTAPQDLDLDHLVALGAAARSGGQKWSEDRKRDYANHLGYRLHLRSVSASANRAKGDRTPDEWKPANKADWCTYATGWVAVKKTWSLTVTSAEKKALAGMLAAC